MIRTFFAVLRELHAGSGRRAYDQPMVSGQIQALELDLSAPLLIRARGRLDVMETALALQPYAEEMMKLADEARAAETRIFRALVQLSRNRAEPEHHG